MKDKSREILYSIGLGVALMIIALIVESIFQSLPLIVLLLKNGIKNVSTNLINIEMKYTLVYSLYLGLIAGLSQETFKYIGVDFKKKEFAAWIGIGFSLVDISVLILEIFAITALSRGKEISLVSVLSSSALIIFLNLLISLLYHPGTAMMLKYGRISGKKYLMLGLAVITHTILDGGVDYTDIIVILKHFNETIARIIYISVALPIAIAVLISGYLLMRKVNIIF